MDKPDKLASSRRHRRSRRFDARCIVAVCRAEPTRTGVESDSVLRAQCLVRVARPFLHCLAPSRASRMTLRIAVRSVAILAI